MRHPMRGILSALALLAITTASATGDITGKWYEKTGSAPLITIYQAGPEYTRRSRTTAGPRLRATATPILSRLST